MTVPLIVYKTTIIEIIIIIIICTLLDNDHNRCVKYVKMQSSEKKSCVFVRVFVEEEVLLTILIFIPLNNSLFIST